MLTFGVAKLGLRQIGLETKVAGELRSPAKGVTPWISGGLELVVFGGYRPTSAAPESPSPMGGDRSVRKFSPSVTGLITVWTTVSPRFGSSR